MISALTLALSLLPPPDIMYIDQPFTLLSNQDFTNKVLVITAPYITIYHCNFYRTDWWNYTHTVWMDDERYGQEGCHDSSIENCIFSMAGLPGPVPSDVPHIPPPVKGRGKIVSEDRTQEFFYRK